MCFHYILLKELEYFFLHLFQIENEFTETNTALHGSLTLTVPGFKDSNLIGKTFFFSLFIFEKTHLCYKFNIPWK